jgi:hypothetical protein
VAASGICVFIEQPNNSFGDFMNKVFQLLATGLLLTCAAVAFGQASSSGMSSSSAMSSGDMASTTPKKKHRLHMPTLKKGTDTGMAGSGPGVPASANGMGTTPATSSAK